MGSKYNDTTSVLQVIGCILNNPGLLQQDGKYFFNEDDFVNELHRVVFGAMLHLSNGGAETFNAKVIEDYLKDYPKGYAVYKKYGGSQWIAEIIQAAEPLNFDYNYQRMKKMSLLRGYESIGFDVSSIYDPDGFIDNIKKKQQQEEEFDSKTLVEIADEIDAKITSIRDTYINKVSEDSVAIGDNILQFLDTLQESTEMGLPLYGDLVNTVTKGCRKGKFYLRSAATGVGKTRTMMADACGLACSEFYDTNTHQWVSLGPCQSTVFISTELELEEINTMALAFLSGVNEDHILTNNYNAIDDEWNRVVHAAHVLKESKLRIEIIPNFSLKDIENIIKRNIRLYEAQYFFYDYIHTSMKILEEITRRSGGIRLREDNILFMLSVTLKDLCVQYKIFLMSATQLNADWKTSEVPDQNLLRGAKSIADKIDIGMILLDAQPEEQECLENILKEQGCDMPNVKLSVYKNRRGKYVRCYIWMVADKGTCRFNPVFATDYKYNYIPMEKSIVHFVNDNEVKEAWIEEGE